MAEEEVGLRLALKNRREVQRGVHDVGDELDRTGDKADRVNRKARLAAGGMLAFGKSGRLAGRAVVAGTGAAVAGLVGAGIVLTKLSKDSIGEAREAQKVGAITRAEIKATSRAANVTTEQVGNLAGAVSAKVGIDDEAIQSGENMILTFKNVRNELGKGNKIFNRATRDAVDLSAAGFGSIISQSKTLAIALNDPEKGMAKLAKAGVTFTDQQKAQVATFVKNNDLLSAQKLILKEVEGQVGGVAAKQATWGEKASVSIGNIKESIGLALLPELDKVEKWFVQKGAPVLENYVGIFEKRGIPKIREYAGVFEDRGIPAMKRFYDEAKPVAESILPAIGTGFSAIAETTKVIAPRLKSIFDGFNNLPDWAKEAIAIGAGGAVVGKKLGAFSLLSKGGALGSGSPGPMGTRVFVTNPGFGGKGAPGVGVPGTGTKTPIVPTGVPGGALGGGLLGAGLFFANSESAMHPNPHGIDYDKIGSEADFMKTIQARRKEGFDAWIKSMTDGGRKLDATTRSMMRGVDQVEGRIGRAKNSTQQLVNVLTGAERPWRPTLEVVGLDPALAKVNNLRTSLLGLPSLGSYGNGLGVLAPASTPRKPKTKSRTPFPSTPQPPVDTDPFGRAQTGGTRVEIPVMLDRHELGRAVVDHLENLMANQ